MEHQKRLEYLDRCETQQACRDICAEMQHDTIDCACFQPMPEIIDFSTILLENEGLVAKKEPKQQVKCLALAPKKRAFKDDDFTKRRREIKKKLFMDLGIVRTNCGIDGEKKEREATMKRRVADTLVTTYCELCEQNFSSSKMLLLHNSKVHETSTLECHLCLKQFHQSSAYNKHMKTHYGPNAQYFVKCDMCDRKFKDKESLSTHMHVTHLVSIKNHKLD